jgi:multidrug efflux pump subunit AcrB
VLIFSRLNTSFFPEDVQYWSYIDVWLPNDTNFGATNETALKAEQIVREQAARFSKD